MSDLNSIGEIRPCPSFRGYSASATGVIISHWRRQGLGRGGGSICVVDPLHRRVLKAWPGDAGYLYVSCKKETGAQQQSVHSMVADAFLGPCPPGLMVRHLDSDHLNNSSGNFAYGTSLDNAQDKKLAGRQPRGQEMPMAKLTDADVLAIRERAAKGERRNRLAAEFQISRGTVGKIVSGQHWAHVGGPLERPPAARLRDARGFFLPNIQPL